MGLWNTLSNHAKAQFLDVIQWLDDSKNTLVYRFPIFNQAIQDGGKLVVREGQAAVFVAEGRLSDVFGPGTYELSTRTKAISGFFESIKYGLNMPYKGDVYFVSTRQFTDQKWGTANPLMLRDKDLGAVRIRAFGVFAYRITDPAAFIREVVGTAGLYTTDEINGQLKRKLVSALADTIGESKIPALDLISQYMDLGDALRQH
ncbi:MAG: SPFH domain-containing protein, partial [Myxococcota bacterium]